ncbi:uncharacterized protein BDR25DRAFT_344730 [Lindgomyces ingoldianus]|uniref:Uncharacterized protein n=1 Tax=Lindgomyces ingoldianus TaxID=673940 RepID=A0ACB6QN88_9PLEO|nr:uncharacterized protein BDR25DRAFT_344730 [Lindgomyces ingoldianus]KAF2467616.1 hypothetical protein BDR25DRAFT_344730 [Lindgomyces ingoldianus]
MGNSHSTPPAPPPKPQRTTITRSPQRQLKYVHCMRTCSSQDRPNAHSSFRQPPQSHAADSSKASFLDLPSEIRNNIYSRVLVCDGYVKLMPAYSTKVPGLILLQTCKQVHDEAASIFFAANAFYIHMQKEVKVKQNTQVQYPDTDQLYVPPWTRNGGEERGGIFFPAPRYHTYLTRLTIDAKVRLNFFHPDYERQPFYRYHSTPDPVPVQQYEDMKRLSEMLNKLFSGTYMKVKELWEKRDREWEGKMVWSHHDQNSREFQFTMSFSVEEGEELATRAVLRNWEFGGY